MAQNKGRSQNKGRLRKITKISRISDTILLVHLYIQTNLYNSAQKWPKRLELFTLRKNHPGEHFTASYLILPLNSDFFLKYCAIKSFADLGYEI